MEWKLPGKFKTTGGWKVIVRPEDEGDVEHYHYTD